MNPTTTETQEQSHIQGPTCLPLELRSCPVLVLGRLGYSLKRRAIEELEAAGSSLYDFSVMAVLAEGACGGQSSIADVLQLDRSQLVGLLDGLEERGLVERRRDPSDRRRHTVTLTAAGARELERVRTLVERIQEEFLAPLDKASREQLFELLSRLARYHDARFAPAEDAAA